jgi:hypothetical protein
VGRRRGGPRGPNRRPRLLPSYLVLSLAVQQLQPRERILLQRGQTMAGSKQIQQGKKKEDIESDTAIEEINTMLIKHNYKLYGTWLKENRKMRKEDRHT